MTGARSRKRLKEGLERDGFALIRNIVAMERLEELTNAVEGARADGRDRGGSVYAIRDLLRVVPQIVALARSRPIRQFVTPIIGEGALLVRGLLC